jgi:hypothetical protein
LWAGIVVLYSDPEILQLGMKLTEGLQRKVGGVILRVAPAAEGLGLQIQHADDGEDAALAIDVLAEGIFAGKEILGGIMTEDNHLGAALLLGIGPHPALRKLNIGGLLNLRRGR